MSELLTKATLVAILRRYKRYSNMLKRLELHCEEKVTSTDICALLRDSGRDEKEVPWIYYIYNKQCQEMEEGSCHIKDIFG